MAGPPMGWYPDPAGSGDERYWDGSSWTHNLRPAPRDEATVSVPSSASAPVPIVTAPRPDAGYGRPAAASAWVTPGVSTAPGAVQLATWGRRALALLLDLVLVYVVVSFALSPFSSRWADNYQPLMSRLESGSVQTLPELWHLLQQYDYVTWMGILLGAQALGYLLYFTLLHHLWGATLGQRALGLHVVRAGRAPERLSWGRAFLRALVMVLCLYVPLGLLVLAIWPASSSTRQGLPDLVARSQVVGQ